MTQLLQPPPASAIFPHSLSARWQSTCSLSEALQAALRIQEESCWSPLSSAPTSLSDLLVSLLLFLPWSLKSPAGQGWGRDPHAVCARPGAEPSSSSSVTCSGLQMKTHTGLLAGEVRWGGAHCAWLQKPLPLPHTACLCGGTCLRPRGTCQASEWRK